MKKFVLPAFILMVAALFGQPAFAGDTHDHGNAAAATEETGHDAVQEQQGMLQEQMRKMRMQMMKINQIKNPEKRQKLLKEHNKSMRDSIRMLRNMLAEMEREYSSGSAMPNRMMGERMMDGSMAGMECEHHRNDGQAAGAPAKKLWICPMHPDEVKDRPGACRICGMDLVDKAELDAPFPEQDSSKDPMKCDHQMGGMPDCCMGADGRKCDHMMDGMNCDHLHGGMKYPMRGMTGAILMLMEQLIEHNEAAMATRK